MAIKQHNSRVKPIKVPVTAYTTPADFQESYENGVLNKALVVCGEHLLVIIFSVFYYKKPVRLQMQAFI